MPWGFNWPWAPKYEYPKNKIHSRWVHSPGGSCTGRWRLRIQASDSKTDCGRSQQKPA